MGLNDHIKDINCVKAPWHTFVLFINCYWAGFGTMLSSSKCCNEDKCDWKQFLIGLLQLLLAFFIIGWVWSCIWGYLIWKKSQLKILGKALDFKL